MAFSHVCREEEVPIGEKKTFKVDVTRRSAVSS